MSGRTSPDLRSDINGSRPPPSYAKTSRNNVCGWAALVSRSDCCAVAEPASVTSASAAAASPGLAPRTWRSGRPTRRRLRGTSGFDERADREFGEEQRAGGVAEQLLRGGRCGG